MYLEVWWLWRRRRGRTRGMLCLLRAPGRRGTSVFFEHEAAYAHQAAATGTDHDNNYHNNHNDRGRRQEG